MASYVAPRQRPAAGSTPRRGVCDNCDVHTNGPTTLLPVVRLNWMLNINKSLVSPGMDCCGAHTVVLEGGDMELQTAYSTARALVGSRTCLPFPSDLLWSTLPDARPGSTLPPPLYCRNLSFVSGFNMSS